MKGVVALAAVGAALGVGVPWWKQRSTGGPNSITAVDVQRRIGIIAHDSMEGRSTPSRGLEATAAYIAREFKRLGLSPGGDSGTFVQRYPLSRIAIDTGASYLTLSGERGVDSLGANRDLLYVSGPRHEARGEVLVLAGQTSESVAGVDAKGRLVMVLGPPKSAPGALVNTIRPLFSKSPAAIVLITTASREDVGRQAARQGRERIAVGPGPATPLIVSVPEAALGAWARSVAVDLDRLRASRTPLALVAKGRAFLRVVDRPGGPQSAPNVVGLLRGADPALRDQYVVFSAHMDHVGVDPTQRPDSIYNGADDDGSGTVGVLELAEAFAGSRVRPKRSLIFLAVSGEENGLWGSDHFTAHPPVPIGQIVADLNMDMIGRNWKDSIVAIGKEHSDLGASLDRVAAAHPELRMKAIDDLWPAESFYTRSDHYNFARRGVPILFFFNGTHADYHEPTDSPDRIDAEKESRILRLVYFLGEDVANRLLPPQWNAESKKKIVGQ